MWYRYEYREKFYDSSNFWPKNNLGKLSFFNKQLFRIPARLRVSSGRVIKFHKIRAISEDIRLDPREIEDRPRTRRRNRKERGKRDR